MFTFAVGVLTQQWHIAITGMVASYRTAAPMWQNIRASPAEALRSMAGQLHPATLMRAMIAISILVAGGTVLTGDRY
jgi:hypothetical protein